MNSRRINLARLGVLLAVWLLVGVATAAAEKPFGSVGLQVVPTVNGELVVLGVVAGAPAAAAGLQPGDLIVQVDDFALAGSEFTEVVSRHLWGPVGSSVTIVYLRPGEAGRQTLKLRRAALKQEVEAPPGVKMLKPEN